MEERTIKLGRREFTAAGILALLSGVTVTIWGCGGSSSPTTPSPAPSGDKTGSISNNHGHSAVITSVQLTAGNAVTLHIRGSASHDHTVDLSAGEIMSVANNQRLSKPSSTDASTDFGFHSHTVTFN